jgi:hypothetical protein
VGCSSTAAAVLLSQDVSLAYVAWFVTLTFTVEALSSPVFCWMIQDTRVQETSTAYSPLPGHSDEDALPIPPATPGIATPPSTLEVASSELAHEGATSLYGDRRTPNQWKQFVISAKWHSPACVQAQASGSGTSSTPRDESVLTSGNALLLRTLNAAALQLRRHGMSMCVQQAVAVRGCVHLLVTILAFPSPEDQQQQHPSHGLDNDNPPPPPPPPPPSSGQHQDQQHQQHQQQQQQQQGQQQQQQGMATDMASGVHAAITNMHLVQSSNADTDAGAVTVTCNGLQCMILPPVLDADASGTQNVELLLRPAAHGSSAADAQAAPASYERMMRVLVVRTDPVGHASQADVGSAKVLVDQVFPFSAIRTQAWLKGSVSIPAPGTPVSQVGSDGAAVLHVHIISSSRNVDQDEAPVSTGTLQRSVMSREGQLTGHGMVMLLPTAAALEVGCLWEKILQEFAASDAIPGSAFPVYVVHEAYSKHMAPFLTDLSLALGLEGLMVAPYPEDERPDAILR